MCSDYGAAPELDQYDTRYLASDNEQYDPMSAEARREVERLLELRDIEERGGRIAQADDLRDARIADEDTGFEEDEATEEGGEEPDVNLEAFDVPLREWIAQGLHNECMIE